MLENLHCQPVQTRHLKNSLDECLKNPSRELSKHICRLEQRETELNMLKARAHKEPHGVSLKIKSILRLLSDIKEIAAGKELSESRTICGSLISAHEREALFWDALCTGNFLICSDFEAALKKYVEPRAICGHLLNDSGQGVLFWAAICAGDELVQSSDIEAALKKYAEALSLAAADLDRLKESLCMLKIKDAYLSKGSQTPKDFIIAAVLCNYALKAQGYDRSSLDADHHRKFTSELGQLEHHLYQHFTVNDHFVSLVKIPDSKVLANQVLNFSNKIRDKRKEIDGIIQSGIEEITQGNKVTVNTDLEVADNACREYSASIKTALMEQIGLIQNTIGPAPCSYALIGFGSLANKEASPYSDVEIGILIEQDDNDKKNKKYFRCLAFLLYMRIINLGETIVRAVKIPCLEEIDFFDGLTPRGLSFDGEGVPGKGCKTPLGNGNFELIQTPEQMAEYINQQWIENEPHLPLELLNFTLIDGATHEDGADYEGLISSYEAALKRQLDCAYQNMTVREYLAKKHLFDEDEATFDMSIDAPYHEGALVHLKKDLYRLPRLLIDRITLLEFGKISGSYLDKLAALAEPDTALLDRNDLEALQEAISATNFLRLISYSKAQSQKDLKDPVSLRGQSKTDPTFVLSPLEKASYKYSYKPFFAFSSMAIEYLKGCREQIRSEPETAACPLFLKILEGLRWGTSVENDIEEAMSSHPKDMRTWALAGEYYKKTNLNRATVCLRKAMARAEESVKKQIDLFHIQVSLAEVYLSQSCYEKAYTLVEAAYTHYSAYPGLKKSAKFIIIFSNLIIVSIRHRPKDLDLFERLLLQGEAILELFSSQNYRFEKAALYVNLSALCSTLHFECNSPPLLEKWKQYAQRALNLKAALYSVDHPDYATALFNFGLYLMAVGPLPEALKYLRKADEIYRSSPDQRLSANHRNVKTAIDQIMQALKQKRSLDSSASAVRTGESSSSWQ